MGTVRLDDFRESENVEDRRGQSSGGGGINIGGGHISVAGIIIALVVSYVTGVNPLTLLGVYESANNGDNDD